MLSSLDAYTQSFNSSRKIYLDLASINVDVTIGMTRILLHLVLQSESVNFDISNFTIECEKLVMRLACRWFGFDCLHLPLAVLRWSSSAVLSQTTGPFDARENNITMRNYGQGVTATIFYFSMKIPKCQRVDVK
jgi:hypothetical protein